ncbi:HNH endonuclease [Pseudooceanicola sp.]|uniref:HNH endonuclease n=1 Tax=Pseudooceanicola sp. TaxID=1914328 RepID=UPI0040587777
MKGRRIEYSEEELDWIRSHCDLTRRVLHREFVERFGRADVELDHIKALCTRNGWKTGRTGQYRKGQQPANKGKKMPYHPNSARTRFKKGNRPHTWRGAGHERIDEKDGYVIMIVEETNPWTGAPTRPVLKHKHFWEQLYGPVPEGHCLKCMDGDKTNTDPSNWVAIPRAMLPRLNGRFGRDFDSAPAELKPVILETARLEYEAREARKLARKARRSA